MRRDSSQLELLNCGTKEAGEHAIEVKIGGEILETSTVFKTYWHFAAERQRIFFNRLRNQHPTTDDPILTAFKFTNAYRASDRVSQFLIHNVIYTGEQSVTEVFFRTLLFKLFNKIETWKLLCSKFKELSVRDFSVSAYDKVLTEALAAKTRIYSAAYIMPSGGKGRPGKKHLAHLQLLEQMMKEAVPLKLTYCRTMQEAFILLRSYPMIGDFLAFQFVIDLNYSNITDFNEMEFVMPGPGARDGIRKCFPTVNMRKAPEIIHYMADTQDWFFRRLGINFESLWGRQLQLIDCQNLFCEVDKYSRRAHPEIVGESGRTRIKQQFRPNANPLRLFYPPKWNVNDKIPVEYRFDA